MQTIGIAGTGRMGTAFATRLVERSHAVAVWNRTPDRTAVAVRAGAAAVPELRSLADCDVIILSLADAAAVHQVVDGLIVAGIRRRLLIDMSTLLPADAISLADKVDAAGAAFVECPVGGTVGPALKGQLLGMAGGTEADVARARPILVDLCRRVDHVGPVGSGARLKLAINLPLAIYWQTLGEAMRLVTDNGIPHATAIDLIADSSAGPTVLRNRSQVVIDTFNGADQPGTFDIDGLAKDLRLALALARSEGHDLPVTTIVAQIYDRVIGDGLGRCDGASLSAQSVR